MNGMNAAQGERFASLCPADTDPAEAFMASLNTELTRIFVANVSGSVADARIWHVPAGGAVADQYALFYDVEIAAGETLQVFADAPSSGIQMKEGETLHVRSSAASALAFNVYGVVSSIAPGV